MDKQIITLANKYLDGLTDNKEERLLLELIEKEELTKEYAAIKVMLEDSTKETGVIIPAQWLSTDTKPKPYKTVAVWGMSAAAAIALIIATVFVTKPNNEHLAIAPDIPTTETVDKNITPSQKPHENVTQNKKTHSNKTTIRRAYDESSQSPSAAEEWTKEETPIDADYEACEELAARFADIETGSQEFRANLLNDYDNENM
ncbi:MAG: hypothetical protein J6X27_01410 [Bacteroidaceae bacterium]|nr:hypothetical protein [Bacteroidaceae bacterium]